MHNHQDSVPTEYATACRLRYPSADIVAIWVMVMLKRKNRDRRDKEEARRIGTTSQDANIRGWTSLRFKRRTPFQAAEQQYKARMDTVNGLGRPTKPQLAVADTAAVETSITDYEKRRSELLNDEKAQSWDAKARVSASSTELEAQRIVYKIRENERVDLDLFGDVPGEAVPLRSTRDMGGHFLTNRSRIDRSRVFDVAKAMPKGCHLHIHFNTELPPGLLFFHARKLEKTMYIRTTRPLLTDADYAGAELVFDVFPGGKSKADCFSDSYNPAWKNTHNSPWMLWSDFRRGFPKHLQTEGLEEGLDAAECWAREKQVFTRDRAYDEHQTVNGVWACFNIGTRAFKGLMNYESVYRWYIGAAIDSMIRDRVMYAELRPMLLDKSIPSDDGTRRLDHNAQMNIICEEVDKKHRDLKSRGQIDRFPFSPKIIYCTPRSIPRAKMEGELEDCIRLKQKYPALICGFDLVGAEDRPNHIGFYADLLVGFQKKCEELQIEIPFLFHAGESLLDTGGSFDPDKSNLYDSLLLNSRRLGHGYALLRHPLLIEKFKAENVCLELCPISNELLHLCRNAREHPFPALLAAGLHCTLNADNPSFFRGATAETLPLSYEFYQVMVGDTRMTVHGWKQLALWSIEHSCLTKQEKERAFRIFEGDWEEFCQTVVAKYAAYSDEVCDVCYRHRCEDRKHQSAVTA